MADRAAGGGATYVEDGLVEPRVRVPQLVDVDFSRSGQLFLQMFKLQPHLAVFVL